MEEQQKNLRAGTSAEQKGYIVGQSTNRKITPTALLCWLKGSISSDFISNPEKAWQVKQEDGTAASHHLLHVSFLKSQQYIPAYIQNVYKDQK